MFVLIAGGMNLLDLAYSGSSPAEALIDGTTVVVVGPAPGF